MNRTSILALALTAGLSSVASAGPLADARGYEACVDAADQEASGLVTGSDYLLSKAENVSQYFINGSAWKNGERVDVRVACDTTPNGRQLLSVEMGEGRFVLDDGRVDVRVAAN